MNLQLPMKASTS